MMKVILVNGSARPNGNTAFALDAVGSELTSQGILTEKIEIGVSAIHGCIGCRACVKAKSGQCVAFKDDPVNGWIRTFSEADGVVVGSPVYFASINGTLKSFLDRAFYVSSVNGGLFRHKAAAGVVAVRRAGSLPALHLLHTYFSYSEMIIPTSNYWNEIHGVAPGDAREDEEGIQHLRLLGANMAWLLKVLDQGKSNLTPPEPVEKGYMKAFR